MNPKKMTTAELLVTVPVAPKQIAVQDDAIARDSSLPQAASHVASSRGTKRCYSPTPEGEEDGTTSASTLEHATSVTPEPPLQKIMKPSDFGRSLDISNDLFELSEPETATTSSLKMSSDKTSKTCSDVPASSLGYEDQLDYGYDQPEFLNKIPSLQEMRMNSVANRREMSNKRRRFNRRCSVTKFSLQQVTGSAKSVGTGISEQQRMTIHVAAQKVLQLLRDDARQNGPTCSW